MESFRFPKLCLARLKSLALKDPSSKLNWFCHLRKFFVDCGLAGTWLDMCLGVDSLDAKILLNKYELFLRERDMSSFARSRSLQLYPYLSLGDGPQSYLRMKLPLYFKKILAQTRLINVHVCRIIFDKKKIYRFNLESSCKFCRFENESLMHILCGCLSCEHICEAHFPEFRNDDPLDFWLNVLSSNNYITIKKAVILIKTILSIRLEL